MSIVNVMKMIRITDIINMCACMVMLISAMVNLIINGKIEKHRKLAYMIRVIHTRICYIVLSIQIMCNIFRENYMWAIVIIILIGMLFYLDILLENQNYKIKELDKMIMESQEELLKKQQEKINEGENNEQKS